MTSFQKLVILLLYFMNLVYGRIMSNITQTSVYNDVGSNVRDDIGKPKKWMTGDDKIVCPAKNSKFPVHLPHPTDCNKFYICDNGSPHLKECHAGLHFNPEIKTCDFPGNAKCEAEESRKPKDRIIDDDTSICPAGKTQLPVHVPHHSECNKFYICNNGIPYLKECQPGLHFNPKIETCDYPENARCDADYKNKIGGKMVEDSGACPVKNDGRPTLIPHPTDCNSFFFCQNGKEIPFDCPTGLHFNAKRGLCDFPENAECDENTTKAMAGVPSPYCPSKNGKIQIFFRHPTNCSVFYMCGNGLAYEFVCPAKLHFNLRKRLCDYERNSGCRVNS